MVFRVSLASAACALVLSVAGPVFGAAPEEELLLGSDRDDQQFADLLPFTRVHSVRGVVTGSLADSTAMAGVPPAVMLEAEQALATTVDFNRELRNGDGFYVRYEQQYSIAGAPIGVGRVLWAELQLPGRRTASIHRFKPVFGPEVFYTANGQATTASPLRLPLDNIVVSSGFGIRVDPFDQPAVRGMGMGPARLSAGSPWKQDAKGVWGPAPTLALGNNAAWQENSTTAGGMLPFAQGFSRGRTTGGATSGGTSGGGHGAGMAMHEGVDLVAPTGTRYAGSCRGRRHRARRRAQGPLRQLGRDRA
jgi:murein DD-endopeptidase MepM/ murein hydrolase activator NlpD